ncbi:MAG: hypothetical protein HC905_16115 [Bacteroidales bacterium]|nr:hypothetical protein [Bacteroidales bacterium]
MVINSKAFEIAPFLLKLDRRSINLIGYDLLPENIRYLKENLISFLIAQRPEYQGYKGILSLFNHIVLKPGWRKIITCPSTYLQAKISITILIIYKWKVILLTI